MDSMKLKPGLRLLRLMMDRHYSSATIDTAAALYGLTEKRTALAEELLAYLADGTRSEREFARMLSDKSKELDI